MHNSIILYLSLLTAILFLVMLAQRLKLPYPILLVVAGLAVSFIPGVPQIKINPEIVFAVFLPPILFDSAWNISWKDFWHFRRVIASFAFLIVIITASVVALVSHWLIPGFTLALGFLLGGIISPPDALSASTVMRHHRVPHNLLSIVEGESLLNDASSLIVFRFATAAVVTGNFVFAKAAGNFVLVIIMGIACGLAVAFIFYSIYRWLPTTPEIDILLSLICPYAMYLLADLLGFSGVLAVVSGGLLLSAQSERILSARSRLQGENVWRTLSLAVNGLMFMLIGLELPEVIRQLGDGGLKTAVFYSAVICAVLIITRLLCTIGASYFTRFISRFITVADSRPGIRGPVVFGWAGMRGVVSLAAALSIPVYVSKGVLFPQRDMILFITFSVILVTLVFQGLTLPLMIKWMKIKELNQGMPRDEQEMRVRYKMSKVALTLLCNKYKDRVSENDLLKSLELRYRTDVDLADDGKLNDSEESVYEEYQNIAAELMKEQRSLLHRINSRQEIDEEIIRKYLGMLDMEEEKMRQRFADNIE